MKTKTLCTQSIGSLAQGQDCRVQQRLRRWISLPGVKKRIKRQYQGHNMPAPWISKPRTISKMCLFLNKGKSSWRIPSIRLLSKRTWKRVSKNIILPMIKKKIGKGNVIFVCRKTMLHHDYKVIICLFLEKVCLFLDFESFF